MLLSRHHTLRCCGLKLCVTLNAYVKILTIKGNIISRWGSLEGAEVRKVEHSLMKLVTYKRGSRELPHLSCHMRYNSLQPIRGPSSSHAGTLISNFKPPELYEINCCCLPDTHSVWISYSSPNRLRQWISLF